MRKTFTVKNNKVTIRSNRENNEFYMTLIDSCGNTYTTTNPTLYWAMSDVHELADNNEIGNALVEKFTKYFGIR